MNIFHTTTYNLYNEHVKKDLVFSVDSDLHFSYMVKDKKLLLIANKIAKISPSYILMPGDLIDSTEVVRDLKEQKRLLNWLKDIATIAPVLISLGSHDYYGGKDNNWRYEFNQELFDEINNINNVTVLDNTSFIDNNVFITGITQSFKYYHNETKKEDKNLLITELQQNLPSNIPNDKLNILLIHSPVYMLDSDILKMVENYDLIVCGHMHNGCVLPIMYELWPSTRGLIAPNKDFFPLNERNTLLKKGDKVLVNGTLTMFQECSNLFQIANILYPIYNSVVKFTNNPEYNKEKLLVKRRYHV